jgi:hypothetical protein
LHLLRDNSDIGFFASIINEAIEAKAVVEMAEQDDLVLKPKIGSPSAATATTSKAASAAVKTASVEASPKAATAAVEAAAATVYATAMVHATAVDAAAMVHATAVDAAATVHATAVHATAIYAAAVHATAIYTAAVHAASVTDRGVSRDVGPAASIGTPVKAQATSSRDQRQIGAPVRNR